MGVSLADAVAGGPVALSYPGKTRSSDYLDEAPALNSSVRGPTRV